MGRQESRAENKINTSHLKAFQLSRDTHLEAVWAMVSGAQDRIGDRDTTGGGEG